LGRECEDKVISAENWRDLLNLFVPPPTSTVTETQPAKLIVINVGCTGGLPLQLCCMQKTWLYFLAKSTLTFVHTTAKHEQDANDLLNVQFSFFLLLTCSSF
jgi:hypothetical protein